MLRENSPTLQRMIASVTPGSGNMNTAQTPMSGQFQTPYPSPKDMVMQAGMASPIYQPYMGYMSQPYPVYNYQIPGNTIAMINGVPTELEYKPHEVGAPVNAVTTNYINIPGAPTNPDLAHLAGKTEVNPITPPPGRYMPNPATGSMYGQAMTNQLNNQQRIIGSFPGYAPYMGGMNYGYQQQPQRTNSHPDIQGAVNIYDGQLVHPHVNPGWYGSPDFPYIDNAKHSMNNLSFNQTMRDKFNEKFPGYANPYMGNMMPQPINAIPPEIQDKANVAAFYGMTYDQFITNGSNAMKLMSRHANRYMKRKDEEIEKRQKIYDIKYPTSRKNDVPEDGNELFYPNGAFDFRGQFTREYQSMFCVNKERLEKAKKTMKVVVTIGDKKVECKNRRIDFVSSRDLIDRTTISGNNYANWLANNRSRFVDMYWKAPERQLDHVEGNVFEVTSRALAFAEQKELEEKLRYQNYTRSSSLYNRDTFISTIRNIRENSKANAKLIKQKKWEDLIHKVAGPKPGEETQIPMPGDRPYICDGDWIIAKPGVDIVGLPLDVSVNKIIKMNTVTGEEEIYDPSKVMGLDVRERIAESMKPNFTEIDDEEELSKRLKRFEDASYES